MTTWANLLEAPLTKALGWVLFHSLWEGALAALLLAGALLVIRSPRVRYACACLTLLGVFAGFAVTLSRLAPATMEAAAGIPPASLYAPRDAGDTAPTLPARFQMADVLPWLVPFWILGVIFFQVRGVAGWMGARRMQRRGVCGAPDPWRRRLDRLRARLRLSTPVALLETCLADVPVVIGYLRPVILVPVGLLAGMPAGQVEAILMHELAHIRRRDYLVNLLQTVVEGFLFYHPAVWWMSRVIRAERENCCDDLVVAASGSAQEYAAALAALEQTRGAVNQAALAANGGSLVKRIQRLLYPPKNSVLAPFVSAGILALAVAGGLIAWQAASPGAPPQVSPYTKWLKEDVAYIINDRERAEFLTLTTDQEHERFITQFWERRNPTPGAAQNTFQIEHYRRLGYADGHFGWRSTAGWKTDRGRIYIVYGPPDEIEWHSDGMPASNDMKKTNTPTEEWRYRSLKGIGTNVIMDFEDTNKTGDFRMTRDPNEKGGVLVQHP